MRVRFKPTIAADLAAIGIDTPPYRIQAITAFAGDDVVAIGGIGFRPDGVVVAFAHFTEAARHYPAAVHRAGVIGMGLIRRCGAPFVLAEAQLGNPAAARWLERFGFMPVAADGATVYVWRRA